MDMDQQQDGQPPDSVSVSAASAAVVIVAPVATTSNSVDDDSARRRRRRRQRRRQQQQQMTPDTPDRSHASGDGRSGGEQQHSPFIGQRRISKHSAKRDSSPSSSTTPRECICGRGVACLGMTQAFRLLGDPRSYYVELPRYRKDPPAYKYVFRNNLRSAYLRHMARSSNDDDKNKISIEEINASPKRRFVALHHFHPTVVRAFYENPLSSAQKHKVPISITEHELRELGMEVRREDQILSASGTPTGGYYFVPSYPQEEAHNDLKVLIQAVRTSRLQKKADVHKSSRRLPRRHRDESDGGDNDEDGPDSSNRSVPMNIEITSTKTNEGTSVVQFPSPPPKPVFTCDGDNANVNDATDDNIDLSLPRSTDTDDRPPASTVKVASDDDRMDAVKEKHFVEAKDDDHSSTDSSDVYMVSGESEENVIVEQKDDDDHHGNADLAAVGLAFAEDGRVEVVRKKDDDHSTKDVAVHDVVVGDQAGHNADNNIDIVGGDRLIDDDDFDQIWNKDNVDAPSSDMVADSCHSPLIESDDLGNQTVLGVGGDDVDVFPFSDMVETKSHSRQIESDDWVNQTILEGDEEEDGDDTDDIHDSQASDHKMDEEKTTSSTDNLSSLASRRDADRPWATPKYRRDRKVDTGQRLSSGPADYIDPNETGDLTTRLSSSFELDEGDDIARIAADMTIFREKENGAPPSSPTPRNYSDPTNSKALSPSSRQRKGIPTSSSTDDESTGSNDFDAVELAHQLPGADPTLRIQIHNDLIAWESKRRSDLSQQLEYFREQWNAACDILRDGMDEARFAERLILGISKASRLFADSLQAVYDDKLFDDRGNAVKNSFLQNRLAKQRSGFEYSIESNQSEDVGQAGQSMLLGSILEVQLEVARAFIESSNYLDQEILPEVLELKDELYRDSQGLESKGESVIQELKRSEIEVKGIWDVFDAMVTGDLMEYSVHGSVHGSTHGGSSHGGSFHGGSYHSSLTGGSGSVHGFLTARGENEAPIVSSVHSPLVRGTFKQLGSVEDGWLIEMYYKSAVAYQRSVFGAAEAMLRKLFQEIITLEERRFRKLHQVMLAFAPRQRRLFNKLPEQLKNVLENLVGLRIDEDSLQKMIDESIRDRSRDHLKGLTAHKSSIMNRSRVSAMEEAATNEVEEIEKMFGNPFASPMILLSKVVELKPTGLKGLVNNAWRPSLAVVTSDGNLLIFETPEAATTPTEAFKSLYPPMNFDDADTWMNGRKAEILKSLTPTLSLKLIKSSIVVSRMQKRQLEIAEEQTQGRAGARFMNAVKTGGVQQSKCTLRIASAGDAAEWMSLLERTKKVLNSSSGKGSRFRF